MKRWAFELSWASNSINTQNKKISVICINSQFNGKWKLTFVPTGILLALQNILS